MIQKIIFLVHIMLMEQQEHYFRQQKDRHILTVSQELI